MRALFLCLPALVHGGVPAAAQQDYSEERARTLAHYSAAAYCEQDLIASWSCDHCQETGSMQANVIYSSKSDMQAYVGLNGDGQVVVAFRGSQSFTNWIANLEFAKEEAYPHCDECKVHSGFYDTWQSVEDEVVAQVSGLMQEGPRQLFVTGHSLGGAVAVLGAASLQYTHGINVEAVYTFGEPRVGNRAFQEYYNQGSHVSWRLTHYKDPVPHLPLESMGFWHVKTEVYYSEDNTQFLVCDGTGTDANCADQWNLDLGHVDNHHHYVGITIDECHPAAVTV